MLSHVMSEGVAVGTCGGKGSENPIPMLLIGTFRGA
jgi:hypothetical protein